MIRGMENSVQFNLIAVSHKFYQKNYNKITGMEIHPGQMPIFFLLGEEDGLTQREIACELRIKPPTVNVSIRRMEQGGYVYRQADENDQRLSRVYLTEKGRTIETKLREFLVESEKNLTAGLSDNELRLLRKMLQQLMVNLENQQDDTENAKTPERKRRRRVSC